MQASRKPGDKLTCGSNDLVVCQQAAGSTIAAPREVIELLVYRFSPAMQNPDGTVPGYWKSLPFAQKVIRFTPEDRQLEFENVPDNPVVDLSVAMYQDVSECDNSSILADS